MSRALNWRSRGSCRGGDRGRRGLWSRRGGAEWGGGGGGRRALRRRAPMNVLGPPADLGGDSGGPGRDARHPLRVEQPRATLTFPRAGLVSGAREGVLVFERGLPDVQHAPKVLEKSRGQLALETGLSLPIRPCPRRCRLDIVSLIEAGLEVGVGGASRGGLVARSLAGAVGGRQIGAVDRQVAELETEPVLSLPAPAPGSVEWVARRVVARPTGVDLARHVLVPAAPASSAALAFYRLEEEHARILGLGGFEVGHIRERCR
mmetsp:Transcript_24346/g.54901  ORF Transcript_24346/g.54901 Transcript_24346/m.54901 type:complete len:262 (-) Transcript_24346:73-858(-)